MATISGRVIFDRDRSATISSGDSGIANIPVVLQNTTTTARLTVLTDASGDYSFINVPNGNYRIVESYGATGEGLSPGDFSAAVPGSVPNGVNPPITSVSNPPTGSTNLDSVTPDTLLVTVSGANLTNENFFNGPVIYTPIQVILDPCTTISGDNLIDAADNGTFGFFPQGAPANTGAPTEPYPDVTPDFTYVLPNPDIYAPFGGEYTVQNIMNNSKSAEIGAWWRIADHTTGNETSRMMIVNGFNPGAVFFRGEVTVKPNTNYLFTSWILNLFKVVDYPTPELGVRVLDENGNVIYSRTLGTIIPVNVNAPEWKEIGSVINSQNNTSLTIEFLSEGPEVIGNDYAIDDVSFNEIEIPEFVPVKTVSSSRAEIGDIVEYEITLTNSCSRSLTDLFFRDIVPNGLSFVPGSVVINGISYSAANPNIGFELPDVPGSRTVTVTFRARVDEIPEPNPALNSATIDYYYTPIEGGIPVIFHVTSNEVPVTVEVETFADISISKSARPASVTSGELLTYTITVTNNGSGTAENVLLYDEIPPELLSPQFSVNGGIMWNPWSNPYDLGHLAAGQSRTILIRGEVRSSSCGIISNTAVAVSTTPDPNPNNNTNTVDTPIESEQTDADLKIIKTACPNPVSHGQCLTYTLTVINIGPETANQVIISDRLSADLLSQVYSADNGKTWNTWNGNYNAGTLQSGESVSILVKGTISPQAKCRICNTATVSSSTSDPNLSNNTSSVIVELKKCNFCEINFTNCEK